MEQHESPAGTEGERTGRRRARFSLVARAVAWLTIFVYIAGFGTTYLLQRGAGLRKETTLEDAVLLVGLRRIRGVRRVAGGEAAFQPCRLDPGYGRADGGALPHW